MATSEELQTAKYEAEKELAEARIKLSRAHSRFAEAKKKYKKARSEWLEAFERRA